MLLFLWLLAGHCVGDFLLQSDEVHNAKKKGPAGMVIHATIIFVSLLLFAAPYLRHKELWLIIILASAGHCIQDTFKLKISDHRFAWVSFVADQLIHVVFLSPVLFFPFAHAEPLSTGSFFYFYRNIANPLLIAGYIISVFGGEYFWDSVRFSWGEGPSDISRRFYNRVERSIITAGALIPIFIVGILLSIGIRFFSRRLFHVSEIVLNLVFSLTIGFILRFFIRVLS